MTDFNWAISKLKEGKKVKRICWKGTELENTGLYLINNSAICYKEKPNHEYFNISIGDYEATDWEIYEELKECDICEVKLSEDNIVYTEQYKTMKGYICKECNRVNVPAPKEWNLSDKKTISDTFKTKHVKEFIKRLKVKIVCSNFDDNPTILKLIDKLAGEKLI